jgi:hypothetical protein
MADNKEQECNTRGKSLLVGKLNKQVAYFTEDVGRDKSIHINKYCLGMTEIHVMYSKS